MSRAILVSSLNYLKAYLVSTTASVDGLIPHPECPVECVNTLLGSPIQGSVTRWNLTSSGLSTLCYCLHIRKQHTNVPGKRRAFQ